MSQLIQVYKDKLLKSSQENLVNTEESSKRNYK